MKHKTNPNAKVKEITIDKNMGVVMTEDPDGSADFYIKFGNPADKKEFYAEAKRFNLQPDGYAKLLLMSGLKRKDLASIANEHGMKSSKNKKIFKHTSSQ